MRYIKLFITRKGIYSKLLSLSSILAFLAIGFIIGRVYSPGDVQAQPTHSTSLRLTGQSLTSPLLLGDIGNDKNSPTLTALSKQVDGYIKQAENENKLSLASVYYRDLKSNEQMIVNDAEKYIPGSLTKVPLMMTYFKISESEPVLLETRGLLNFQEDYNAGLEIKPAKYPMSGQEYSIDELIAMMIKYSDNIGFQLMINGTKTQDTMKKVYTDFGLNYFFDQKVSDVITVRDFSRFIRSLYNATYLSVNNSEKALLLMSESDFKNGIVAGVPNDIKIAHKYGLTTQVDPNGVVGQRQLHDCGIVYHPTKPYLLCVMTKSAASIPQIEDAIKGISQIIYSETDKKK